MCEVYGDYEIGVNDKVEVSELDSFFIGWQSLPSKAAREQVLMNSDLVVTARYQGKLIGFATVLTDGSMFAYISLLEVLPKHQGKGVGRKLLQTVVSRLSHLYSIAAITDPEIVGFYEKLGFEEITGVHKRAV